MRMKKRNLKLLGVLFASSIIAAGCISSHDRNSSEYANYRKAGGILTYWEWKQAGSPNAPLVKSKDVKVLSASVDKNGHVIIVLSNGQTIDAGECPVPEKERKFSVSFYCGDSIVSKKEVKRGDKLSKPILDTLVVRGWFLDTEKTKRWDFDKDIVEENITLYADISGAQVSGVALVDNILNIPFLNRKFIYGKPYSLPVPLDYSSEYVFSSWMYEGKPIDISGIWNIPKHATLFASWKRIEEGFHPNRFGFYPQTLVKDKNLIKQLSKICDSKNIIEDEKKKRHSTASGDYNYVGNIHLEYDGFRYKRFAWKAGRDESGKYSRDGVSFKDIASPKNTYFFKIEPIEWHEFDFKGEHFAISKKVLDMWWAMRNKNPYADGKQLNDYTYSHFRNRMNGNSLSNLDAKDQYSRSYFDTDFIISEKQKSYIVPHFKNDKLFFLNKEECNALKAKNPIFLKGETSDHALAYMVANKVSADRKYMEWMTRDAASDSKNLNTYMWRLDEKGAFDDWYEVDQWGGVRPAIKIKK